MARLLADIDANRVAIFEALPPGRPGANRSTSTMLGRGAEKLDLSPLLPDVRAGCSMFPQLQLSGIGAEEPAWYEWPESLSVEDFGCPDGSDIMMMMLTMIHPELMAQGTRSNGVLGLLTFPGGVHKALDTFRQLEGAKSVDNASPISYTMTGSRSKPWVLRDLDSLAQAKACLFSMLRFDTSEGRLAVLMTSAEKERLGKEEHVGFLLRTDSWEPLYFMGCFPFVDGKPVVANVD